MMDGVQQHHPRQLDLTCVLRQWLPEVLRFVRPLATVFRVRRRRVVQLPQLREPLFLGEFRFLAHLMPAFSIISSAID